FFTSPAMRDGNPLASKRVIGPIPDRPATIVGQASATPSPTGETMPSPVTTTRRMSGVSSQRTDGPEVSGGTARGAVPARCMRDIARILSSVLCLLTSEGTALRAHARRVYEALFLQMRTDVVDRLLHRGDLLGVVIGNLGFEFLFERHHELDGVERIGAEIVDERRFVLDLGLVDAQLLCNDFLDALFDVIHASPPLRGVNNKTGGFYQRRGSAAWRLRASACRRSRARSHR